jgi:hypothetical protein
MVQFGCCFGVLFDLPIERKDKHIEKIKITVKIIKWREEILRGSVYDLLSTR